MSWAGQQSRLLEDVHATFELSYDKFTSSPFVFLSFVASKLNGGARSAVCYGSATAFLHVAAMVNYRACMLHKVCPANLNLALTGHSALSCQLRPDCTHRFRAPPLLISAQPGFAASV